MKNLPIQLKILIGILILLFIGSGISHTYKSITNFYNTEKFYQFDYAQLTQAQITTFDNNFLAFDEKTRITIVNKETFIKVTEIIMSARTDGQQVAWKWVRENQQIPYEEFTKFYADLSNFTEGRYKENNSIELKKQEIAKKHNMLIETFPGVIYNYFFKFKELTYKEGFISDETKETFNIK